MELCGSKKTQRGLAEQDYSVATLSVVLGGPKLLSEVDIKRARGRYCVPPVGLCLPFPWTFGVLCCFICWAVFVCTYEAGMQMTII